MWASVRLSLIRASVSHYVRTHAHTRPRFRRPFAPETGIWRVVRILMAMLGVNSVSNTHSQSAGLSTTGRGAGCCPTDPSRAIWEPGDTGELSRRRGDSAARSSGRRAVGEEDDAEGAGSAVRCTANSCGSLTRRSSFLMLPGRSVSGFCLAPPVLMKGRKKRARGLGHRASSVSSMWVPYPIMHTCLLPPHVPDLLAQRLIERA